MLSFMSFSDGLHGSSPECVVATSLRPTRVRGHGAHVRKYRLFGDGSSIRIRGVCLSGGVGLRRLDDGEQLLWRCYSEVFQERNSRDLLDGAGGSIDVRSPQFGRQQMLAAEDVERQVAEAVVIAVEKPPFLWLRRPSTLDIPDVDTRAIQRLDTS